MELHRKQQLMPKKNLLDPHFHSIRLLRRNSQRLQTAFSLKRYAVEIISATQADEDFERDSLALQSSRTMARVHLHTTLQKKKIVKVSESTMFKDEHNTAQVAEFFAKLPSMPWRKP